MAGGDSVERLLQVYPTITREDILACLEYAAASTEEQMSPFADVMVRV